MHSDKRFENTVECYMRAFDSSSCLISLSILAVIAGVRFQRFKLLQLRQNLIALAYSRLFLSQFSHVLRKGKKNLCLFELCTDCTLEFNPCSKANQAYDFLNCPHFLPRRTRHMLAYKRAKTDYVRRFVYNIRIHSTILGH